MKLAKTISEKNLARHVGNVYKVLIENKTIDNKYYIGRTYMDIPDTDGVVIVKNTVPNLEEKFIDCRIIGYRDYDLIGEIE